MKNADVRPNATTYAGWHQGYANNPAGAKVTAKGLELSGGPSQVINGYVDNDSTIGTNKNFDLAAKITGADFTASEGVANLQVPLFGENVVPSASGSKFATLRSATDEGSRIKLTDEWESSRAIGTIPANTPTPLKTILAALGNYKVVAFGVQADNNAVVTDITWDGTTYVFKEPVPVVAKQASKVDIYRVAPKSGKITTNNTVKVYASVTIGGKAAPAGTVVTGFAKGKKVATGKVNSQGKVKLTLRKLPKGKSTLKAQLSSTGTVTGSTDSVAVKVVKKK
ncbi:MAG: hypothetical protein ABW075_02615 [Aeromicrobium sp.]